MPDCFLSYSTQDEELASRIRSELRAQNLTVFMDFVSIQPGEQWPEEIQKNIRASLCLLFLASKWSRVSQYANQELGMAFGADKTVILVLLNIAPSELPGFAAHVQVAFRLNGTSEREIRDLGSKVAEIVRKEKAKRLPEVEQAIKRLEARAYESAIDMLTQAVKLAPLSGDTNYYLALASLKGKRPRSLILSEADDVSRYLERACASATPQAHYFYLWAVLKFDFYRANGLVVDEPDVEECLIAAQGYPFEQDAFEQMIKHAEADESLRSLGLI